MPDAGGSDEDRLNRKLQVYESSKSQEGSLLAVGQGLLHVQGGADWRCEVVSEQFAKGLEPRVRGGVQ